MNDDNNRAAARRYSVCGTIKPMRNTVYLLPAMAYALLCLLALLIYRDFGMTWDEGVTSEYGEMVLDYFRSNGEDTSALHFFNLMYYGPLFELVITWVYEKFPGDWIYVRHLMIGFLGLTVVPILMLMASLFNRGPAAAGIWLAVFCGVAIMMLPRYVGHLFNNSKDIALAVTMTMAIAATAYYLMPGKQGWRRAALAGVAMGLVAAARPAGLPIAIAMAGLGILALLIRQHLQGESLWPLIQRVLLHALLVLVIAWVIMVVPWPWAHQAPLANPVKAILYAAEFPSVNSHFYQGTYIANNNLPWYYMPHYLIISTPILPLLLSLVGLFAVVFQARKLDEYLPLYVLVTGWLTIPIIMFLVMVPVSGIGVHHFLFLLPALAFFTSYGLLVIVQRLNEWRELRIWNWIGLFCLLLPLPQILQLHPYQIAYYNELVGGLSEAGHRYETDYLVSGHREAIGWLNNEVRRSDKPVVNVIIVANGLSITTVSTFATDRIRLLPTMDPTNFRELPPGIDYYVSSYKYEFDHQYPDAPIVYEVARDGIRFVVIKGASK